MTGRATLALVLAGLATAARAQEAADGAALYARHCSVCHQAGGVGVPGAFPRLSGRAATLAGSDAGRRLLIATVLYGMAGRLQTAEGPVTGVMPALGKLSDAEAAAVLNHVAAFGGTPPAMPFTAAEVAAVRAGPPLTGAQVSALAKSPP